ncbi:hypothetical protein [Paraburkholderia youngii]|uniref:hypothetical protein n=1 Tax=Paraburkholderia youngii TaxID=2782701 RepID=UPI003D259C47
MKQSNLFRLVPVLLSLVFPAIPVRAQDFYEKCGVDPARPIDTRKIFLTGATTKIPTLSFTREATAKCPAQGLLVLTDNTLKLQRVSKTETIYTFRSQIIQPACALVHPYINGGRAGLSVGVFDADGNMMDAFPVREFSQGSPDTRPAEETEPIHRHGLSADPVYVIFGFIGTCTGQMR